MNLPERSTATTTPIQTSTSHSCSVVYRHVCHMDRLEPSSKELDGQDGSILTRNIVRRPRSIQQRLGRCSARRRECTSFLTQFYAHVNREKVKNGRISTRFWLRAPLVPAMSLRKPAWEISSELDSFHGYTTMSSTFRRKSTPLSATQSTCSLAALSLFENPSKRLWVTNCPLHSGGHWYQP